MSRIGSKPIVLPANVQAKIEEGSITITGPKGIESVTFDSSISLKQEDNILTVHLISTNRTDKAKQGLYRSLIANHVTGVTDGFRKVLDIVGVGYRVAKEGSNLTFSLGYSHPIIINPPQGITFETEGVTKVIVLGTNKESVGQIAANIRKLRKPDPYKQKGIRYEGERIRKKAGKSVK
jgi:large subunit ribosomal protein L6